MENEFIAWLRDRLPASDHVPLGVGDDAAIVQTSGGEQCVAAVDMLMEGTHFDLAECTLAQVGRKALAVNLSDMAAMAAQPRAALVALALPRGSGERVGREVLEGMLPLAERHQTAIAGGDTNTWSGPLVVSVTILGVPGPSGVWLRSGARPGDAILVTGALGGSLLGRHLDFEPRVAEALELAKRCEIHAAADISDGLLLDLWRMTQASGCGAELDFDRIPVSDDAREIARRRGDGVSPLEHALSDGEDFELLLAAAPREAERLLAEQPLAVPLSQVGVFVEPPGLWRRGECQRRERLTPRGYQH